MTVETAIFDDEVSAVLTGPNGTWTPSIPARPGAGERQAWVDYVVALGGTRDFISEWTEEMLVEMANRLGG